jgi:hypothetical protein
MSPKPSLKSAASRDASNVPGRSQVLQEDEATADGYQTARIIGRGHDRAVLGLNRPAHHQDLLITNYSGRFLEALPVAAHDSRDLSPGQHEMANWDLMHPGGFVKITVVTSLHRRFSAATP